MSSLLPTTTADLPPPPYPQPQQEVPIIDDEKTEATCSAADSITHISAASSLSAFSNTSGSMTLIPLQVIISPATPSPQQTGITQPPPVYQPQSPHQRQVRWQSQTEESSSTIQVQSVDDLMLLLSQVGTQNATVLRQHSQKLQESLNTGFWKSKNAKILIGCAIVLCILMIVGLTMAVWVNYG